MELKMRIDNKQERKSHKYTNQRIIFDVITNGSPSTSPIDEQNSFEYIQHMTEEMRVLARNSNNDFLAYLLSMATEEARQSRAIGQPAIEKNWSA
jgi:hypothetical protein